MDDDEDNSDALYTAIVLLFANRAVTDQVRNIAWL